MPATPDSERALFDAVRLWVRRVYGPGRRAVRLAVRLDDGERVVLPVPVPWEQPPAAGFVPTAFQQAVLEALDCKALRTEALAAAVGDRARLFRPKGGLAELREHGLVSHHERLGYYRPDSPPPQLESQEEP